MYLLKYLNFSKGVLKHYVIYTILWMRSYMKIILFREIQIKLFIIIHNIRKLKLKFHHLHVSYPFSSPFHYGPASSTRGTILWST